MGAATPAQTGNAGTKDSGKAISLAPDLAASAIRLHAFCTVALASRKTGATCAEHALNFGYDMTPHAQYRWWWRAIERATSVHQAGSFERSCRSGMFFASSSFGIRFLTSSLPPSTRLM